MMSNAAVLSGVVYKSAILGSAAALACGLIWGGMLGVSLIVGVCLAVANLLLMAWVTSKILRRPAQQTQSALLWGGLFLLKLLVLFGVTYYVIAVARLNPLGFVAGYTILLIAIVWQTLSPSRDKR